jgi:SrtB family sortase
MVTSQNGEHVKGWAYIPGLGLDTVVVQWGDNEYFKDKSFTLDDSSYGCTYFDYRTDISYILDAGNIVVYGFNNIGGQHLKKIVKYAQEDYFKEYTLIELETLYGKYNFRLFSVHIEEDDSEYVMPVSDKEKKDFIDLIVEKSMFEADDLPEDDSVILTFSTDVESAKGERLLVHAFLDNY